MGQIGSIFTPLLFSVAAEYVMPDFRNSSFTLTTVECCQCCSCLHICRSRRWELVLDFLVMIGSLFSTVKLSLVAPSSSFWLQSVSHSLSWTSLGDCRDYSHYAHCRSKPLFCQVCACVCFVCVCVYLSVCAHMYLYTSLSSFYQV